MASFQPIASAEQLPAPGAGFERTTLDLKAALDLTKTANMAIDVAAFANHLGRTLLVGAAEQDGRVGAYVPATEAINNERKDAISKAIADRCRPAPRIDLVPIAQGAGFVLAVNVWPQPSGMVGVRIAGKKDAGGYGGDAWAFPVRSGSDAFYVSAENLPMYLDSQVRRIVLLLSRIPLGATVEAVVIEQGNRRPFLFEGLDEEGNVIKLRATTAPNDELWVALDAPQRVFQGHNGQWCLVFANRFDLFRPT